MPIVLPLVALDVLVVALWVIAAALAIALIMRKVGDVFRPIPIVGGAIAGAVGSVASAISNACGFLIKGIDSLMGAAWHLLSRYLDTLWHTFESQAHLLAQIAEIVGSQLAHVSGLSSLVHRLEQAWHGIEHGIKTLTREWHGIDRRVTRLERDIARGIGNDVRAQVKALDREITGIEKRVIPDLRAGIRAAEGEVTQLGNFIKAIPGVGYLEWAAGIVAAAVGIEILNLFRCSSLLNSAKNRGCGLWNGLEDLLGLFVDLIAFGSLCEALDYLIPIASAVAVPAVEELTAAIELMPCVRGNEPAALAVPALHTSPATQSLLAGV